MIEQLAATPFDSRLTDLSMIGVPAAAQSGWPSVSGFPRKFSKACLPVWVAMINSAGFKSAMTGLVSRDLAWHTAVQEFLKACGDAGVFPFSNSTDTTRNEFILEYVRKGRLALCLFVDKTQLFENLAPRKVYREYQRTPNGLIVSVWAEMFPIKFPTFRQWLTQSPMPRFITKPSNRYVKRVTPTVNMWVKYVSDSRITVGYTIQVTGTINIPGNTTPTRKDVDAFMDRMILYPLVRAHKFEGVRNRLF